MSRSRFFLGGSALAANSEAGLAFANTFFAPAAAMVTWLLLDHEIDAPAALAWGLVDEIAAPG